MNRLEHWYRKRFRPVDDGFLFTQWGYEVYLSHAEVAQLLGDWRRVWMNPFLWGGWLALGVAFPAILYLKGSGVAAFMVALLFGVMMSVTLMHALRRANELAEPRVPLEAARAFSSSQPTWPIAIVGVGFGIEMLSDAEGIWIWVSSLLIAINVAILLSVLWRWIRARSAPAA